MELHELQKQIIENKEKLVDLDKMFIFTGEEVGIMDIYLQQIRTVLNCDSFRLDTIQEAYRQMTSRGISKQRKLYIVRDDKEYLKQDKLWDRIEKDCYSAIDTIIIIYTKMDKRSKFYKKYKDRIVVFDRLNPELLVKYVQKEIPVKDNTAKNLVEICECDYSRILLECDKVKQYYNSFRGSLSMTYDKVVEKLVTDGTIHEPIGDITFKLTDAIVLRDRAATAMYLQQAKLKQEPEILVLSILYNNFKQILMVQGLGRNKANAAARTGLTGWQVKMATDKMGHYNLSELQKALKLVQFIEKGIKTGKIEANIALEYLVVNIL